MEGKRQKLSGWGNIPHTESDLIEIDFKDHKTITEHFNNIIARGLGRSYADQSTNTNKFVLDVTKWNEITEFDETTGVIECQSGCSLEQIILYAAPKGWFPMICPGTKFITVGGAIANDVHGKAHHVDGSFINCVDSMKVLLANGQVVYCSRNENSDLFYGSFGGLGLLGVILTAKLNLRSIETSYFVQKSIPVSNLDDLLRKLDEADRQYNYSVAWVDSLAMGRNLGKGVLIVGNAASISDLPPNKKNEPLQIHKKSKVTVPFYLPSFVLNTFTVKILNSILYWKQKNSSGLSHYDTFFYPLDMINNWNRGYGKRGFIQYQFVLPEKNGKENIRKIMESITMSGCNPFLNVLKKFGSNKSGPLSFPMPGYTFAIDFPITKRLKNFTRKLDMMVLEAGGRLYLGKDAYLDADTFRQMYPEFEAFSNLKSKYDPDNIWQSDISRRLKIN